MQHIITARGFCMSYIKLQRKTFILLISYFCAALVTLTGAAVINERRADEYERHINAGYTRAFYEFSADLAELDMSLQKAIYSTSPALLSSLCANIYGKASAAQTSLAELPFSDYTLENAAAFITRTGDFAFSLGRKVSGGVPLSEAEFASLKAISDTATILSQNLLEMQGELEKGTVRISDIGISDAVSSNASELLGERFQAIENEFPEIPTLVYDGPFSQHLDTLYPALLKGTAAIGCNDALKIAADFMQVPADELSVAYSTNGKLPLYCFSDANGTKSINITKQGGKVFSMSVYRSSAPPAMDTEQAIQTAKEFLSARGYSDLAESYWIKYDDIILVNFAASSGDWLYYPDLVKAEISLDTGEVVGFEAAGYINNHTVRSVPKTKIGREEAAAVIPDALKILSSRLCVIPSSGKFEVPCYEFTCENERGNHYLIYVNTETGEQEKIICLIENDNGTLAM